MGHLGTRDGRRVKNRGKGSRARLHRQQDNDRGGHHPLHSTSYLTIPGAVAPLLDLKAINLCNVTLTFLAL